MKSHVAVDLLVTIMGVFAVLYWLFRATVVGTWAKHNIATDDREMSYFTWNSSKYAFRTLSTGFLVFMFTNIARDIHEFEAVYQNRRVHLLLPLFWLTIIAIYINSIIATYNGKIEKDFSSEVPSIGFQILYQAGGPIHLGFCLHVCVHFGYIVKALWAGLVRNDQMNQNQNQQGEVNEEERDGENTPLMA